MNINVTSKITDLDNQPIVLDGKTLTLADASLVALNANFDDEKIDYKEKSARFVLMTKIHTSKETGKHLEVSTEDASLLKKLIGKIWNPLIVGRCVEIIETKSKEVKTKEQ